MPTDRMARVTATAAPIPVPGASSPRLAVTLPQPPASTPPGTYLGAQRPGSVLRSCG